MHRYPCDSSAAAAQINSESDAYQFVVPLVGAMRPSMTSASSQVQRCNGRQQHQQRLASLEQQTLQLDSVPTSSSSSSNNTTHPPLIIASLLTTSANSHTNGSGRECMEQHSISSMEIENTAVTVDGHMQHPAVAAAAALQLAQAASYTPNASSSNNSNVETQLSPIIHSSNLLQPCYYAAAALPSSFGDFNVLQMCYQPFFSDISAQEISQSTESLYGFANRLHPITPTGVQQEQQLTMPQSYHTRSSYMVNNGNNRPSSAAGKRGGRRPKEYEDYDHVALSEEERDKRDKRRLRNKEAAARCRQRRLDLMQKLQHEVDQLKEINKIKDDRIAELQTVKNGLLAVIQEHQCVLPDSLRQTLDVDMSSTHQYMPRGATLTPPTLASSGHIQSQQYQTSTMMNRKRPAAELVPDLRQQQQHQEQQRRQQQQQQRQQQQQQSQNSQIHVQSSSAAVTRLCVKQEPTLYDVNGRDLADEEVKRPTSLPFSESTIVTSAYSTSLSGSGVPITTPSNLIASSEFGNGNLLDGPTGLTPCHPPQATAFQLSSLNTPLGDGRSFETL